MLVQAYTPGAGEELRRALVTAAISLMQAPYGSWGALVRLPARSDYNGVRAGMTFAVPRNLGARPLDKAALTCLERLGELHACYDELFGEDQKSTLGHARQALDGLVESPSVDRRWAKR
jgi:hypothetical protein